MVRVLFVCLGNICRSPMAEGVFQHLVEEAGLSDQIMVDSAGTGRWHLGEQAHRGTRQILAKNGIDYRGRARLLDKADLTHFDYVLAMDYENLSTLRSMVDPDEPPGTIGLFLDYAPEAGVREVPDPYYSGRFDVVYDLVSQAAAGLLEQIRGDHAL